MRKPSSFPKERFVGLSFSSLSNQGVGCLNPVLPFGVFSSFFEVLCWAGKNGTPPPAPSVCVFLLRVFFVVWFWVGWLDSVKRLSLKNGGLWFGQLQTCKRCKHEGVFSVYILASCKIFSDQSSYMECRKDMLVYIFLKGRLYNHRMGCEHVWGDMRRKFFTKNPAKFQREVTDCLQRGSDQGILLWMAMLEGCIFVGVWIITAWWFQTFFMLTPTWGNDPIWRSYFSDGLKPPTR